MDSANILSILQTLGQGAQPAGPPANVLQAAAAPQPAAVPPPQPQQAPIAPQEVAQAAVAASPPTPKPRRSLLDTIGRISDVFATVGGAHPLYQPTLDAREKHGFDVQDHSLAVDAATIKNATDKFALGQSEREQLANALGAVNDSEDAAMWPQIAAQAGIDPVKAAAIGKIIQANPEAAKILASSLGGDTGDDSVKYGGNIIYGKDANGNIHAYQANITGGSARDVLPEGITPIDPLQFVNAGNQQVGVGKLSGNPKTIIPTGPSPNTVLTTNTNRDNNIRTTNTQLTIAGMPARPKDAPGSKASDPAAGLQIISDIQKSFDKLHNLQALPGEGGAVGNAVGAIGRTGLGQAFEAKTGISAAAQERELLAKNLANLQSDLIKSLPGNATRTRFEQEIQKKRLPDPNTMNYNTANTAIAQIRQAYETALRSQPAATPAGNSSSLPTLTPEQAMRLPSGARFRTVDGRELVRH